MNNDGKAVYFIITQNGFTNLYNKYGDRLSHGFTHPGDREFYIDLGLKEIIRKYD